MKTVTIGICKEPGIFRAYCAHNGENIALAKSTSRAEALVQLFDKLATDYVDYFYDGDLGDIFLDNLQRRKECERRT